MRAEYLGFEPGAPETQARALFAARFGVQRGEVITTGGALLLGPIPGGDLVQPGALARTQDAATPRTGGASGCAQLELFETRAHREALEAILEGSEGKYQGRAIAALVGQIRGLCGLSMV